MLFETCIMSTLLAIANPSDPTGQTMYPSGIYDDGDFIFSAPPASFYPLLKLDSTIELEDGSTIMAGNYCVKPSKDEKKIYLIQGHETLCECTVIENTFVSSFVAKPIAKVDRNGERFILTYQTEHIVKKALIPTTLENQPMLTAHLHNNNL